MPLKYYFIVFVTFVTVLDSKVSHTNRFILCYLYNIFDCHIIYFLIDKYINPVTLTYSPFTKKTVRSISMKLYAVVMQICKKLSNTILEQNWQTFQHTDLVCFLQVNSQTDFNECWTSLQESNITTLSFHILRKIGQPPKPFFIHFLQENAQNNFDKKLYQE